MAIFEREQLDGSTIRQRHRDLYQHTYNNKLDAIIRLPQFEKETQKRKNEKHPVLKGEERIVRTLKKLKEENKIDESLYEKLKPVGK